MVDNATPSRPRRVRPAIRRLVYWLAPVLLVIAAWQIWDAVETSRLERALEGAFPDSDGEARRAAAGGSGAVDDAARYYAAAAVAVQYPESPWRDPSHAYREALARGSEVPPAAVMAASSAQAVNRMPLDLMRQARAMPFGAFRPGTEFNYRFGNLVALARFAALQTLESLREGNAEAATASLAVRLQLLRAFDEELRLYSRVAGSSELQWIATDLGVVLGRGGAAPSALDELDALLERSDAPDDLARWLQAEGTFFHETLRSSWTRGFPMRPLFKHYAVGMVEVTGQALAAARLPWPDRIAAMNGIPDHRAVIPINYQFFSAQARLETFRDAVPRLGSGVAATRAARLAIRIDRHYRATGDVPGRIEDLSPPVNGDALVDPFTGAPLRYAREENGFVIYTVGPDGRDERGKLTADLPAGRMPGTLPPPDVGVRVHYLR